MTNHFDKRIKVKIDKEKKTVSLSIRVTEEMVNVYKTTFNEFNVMLAEYHSQLYDAGLDASGEIAENETL